jgi:hypothetical protein
MGTESVGLKIFLQSVHYVCIYYENIFIYCALKYISRWIKMHYLTAYRLLAACRSAILVLILKYVYRGW